ncbi:MAG: cobalt ECF transporter T component CbiQ [Nitrososphaerales archaeon]
MLSSFLKVSKEIVYNERFSLSNGFLQSIDPRVKVFSFTAFILVAIVSKSILPLITLITMTFILSIASKIPLRFFTLRTTFALIFVALIALPLPFITPGSPIATIGNNGYQISITSEGVFKALQFVLRVWACITPLILLVLTTRFSSLIHSLERFRVPRVFTNMMSVTYRFIFLFIDEAYRMILARESRTVRRESCLRAMKALASMMSTLFIRSYERGERVYLAMMARGYEGNIRPITRMSMNGRDIIFGFFAIAICMMIISLDLYIGIV